MSMIEVKNVTKSFGDLTVLKDFSVDFNQEGVTVLLGPSGTGKSTLLRCINALETIDSGDIIVNGLSVKEKKNLRQIRLDLSLIHISLSKPKCSDMSLMDIVVTRSSSLALSIRILRWNSPGVLPT